nr:hypothetical protein Iba_chr13aCG2280 [Ipomoea batatas]GME14321.1 hypothetical protein Iba_scaffold15159CG0140 [Ipomoea batatas]
MRIFQQWPGILHWRFRAGPGQPVVLLFYPLLHCKRRLNNHLLYSASPQLPQPPYVIAADFKFISPTFIFLYKSKHRERRIGDRRQRRTEEEERKHCSTSYLGGESIFTTLTLDSRLLSSALVR